MTDVVHVHVNGQDRTVPAGTTVAQLVGELTAGTQGRGIAVALDREVLPRSRWDEIVIEDDARIEVVTAAAGG